MMAAGGTPGGCHRSAADRGAARRSAREAARLRLAAELRSVRGRLEVAEEALGSLVDGSEAAQRVRALLPALLAKLEGRPPSWLESLRRNVALHASAEGVDVSTASASELRRVQHGPRLEARLGEAAEEGGAHRDIAATYDGHNLSRDIVEDVVKHWLATERRAEWQNIKSRRTFTAPPFSH